MRILGWIFASFLILLLQSGLLEPLGIVPVHLVLVLMVLALLSGKEQASLTVAIAGGLMLDFLSGFPDGIIAFSLLLVWMVVHIAFERFINRELSPWVFITSVVVGSWVYALSLVFVSWVYSWFGAGLVFSWGAFAFDYLLLVPLLNLIFSYPVWKYIKYTEITIAQVTDKK